MQQPLPRHAAHLRRNSSPSAPSPALHRTCWSHSSAALAWSTLAARWQLGSAASCDSCCCAARSRRPGAGGRGRRGGMRLPAGMGTEQLLGGMPNRSRPPAPITATGSAPTTARPQAKTKQPTTNSGTHPGRRCCAGRCTPGARRRAAAPAGHPRCSRGSGRGCRLSARPRRAAGSASGAGQGRAGGVQRAWERGRAAAREHSARLPRSEAPGARPQYLPRGRQRQQR